MNPRRHNVLECRRCGGQEFERRSGHFTDPDYYELLHEYLELERELKRLQALLARAEAETAYERSTANWAMKHMQGLAALALEQARGEVVEGVPF